MSLGMSRRELARLVQSVADDVSVDSGTGNVRRGTLNAFDAGMRIVRNQPIPEHLSASAKYILPFVTDPGIAPFIACEDALGQVYQSLNAPALQAAYRGTARERRKFTNAEIPAVTQLFTPRWVVEYLLHNTLGRLWLHMHPESALKSSLHWLVPDQDIELPNTHLPTKAAEIRICDPACGTMNFGLVAIEMLRLMYLEEIDRAGQAGWPAQPSCGNRDAIDQAILKCNLHGIDLDPIAIDLARRTLEIKTSRCLLPGDVNLHVADALFERAIKIPFDVVVTNPPFLSARNLSTSRVRRLKDKFPSAWRDAYACFIELALAMLKPGGRAGILSMHSFMFTGAFEGFRKLIMDASAIEAVAHFGPGLFDVGNPGTLQTAAIVLRKDADAARRDAQTICIDRLVDCDDKESSLRGGNGRAMRFFPRQAELCALPRRAWMYWLSPGLRRAFTNFPTLGTIASPRQGLATTDNMRFVRYWWEVESPGHPAPRDRWKPYAKGGRFRRWYESPRHRVNWENDGREIKQSIIDRYPYLNGKWEWVAKNTAYYGRPGITYSYLTSGVFSARQLEEGSFFDVAGSALFPEDPLSMLGILNSSIARQLLSAINPTVNFQVGDLRQLPVPRCAPPSLASEVQRAIDLTKACDAFDETCPHFAAPRPWKDAAETAAALDMSLGEAEHRIDAMVAAMYGEDQPARSSPLLALPLRESGDLARRWISFALQTFLGRFAQPVATVARLDPLDLRLETFIREFLSERNGANAAMEIERCAGGLQTFLAGEFLPWHNRMYQGRPILWGLQVGETLFAVPHEQASSEALRDLGMKVPDGWRRHIDDGIAINLAPLWKSISDAKLRTSLRAIALEIASGKYSFAATAGSISGSTRGFARPARPIRIR